MLEDRKAEINCHASATQVACEKKKADPLQAILDSYEECSKENQVSPRIRVRPFLARTSQRKLSDVRTRRGP